MCRKFLQMGYTRSRRYANHKSGRKYDAEGKVAPLEVDSVKAESAEIFRVVWKRLEAAEASLLCSIDIVTSRAQVFARDTSVDVSHVSYVELLNDVTMIFLNSEHTLADALSLHTRCERRCRQVIVRLCCVVSAAWYERTMLVETTSYCTRGGGRGCCWLLRR